MTPRSLPIREFSSTKREFPVAANTLIPVGNLVCLNDDEHAVRGSDEPGLAIAGISRGPSRGMPFNGGTTDNSHGKAGQRGVRVDAGLFCVFNSSNAPVTSADLGKTVFVEDARTVARHSKASVAAGVAVSLVGAIYVWLFVGPPNTLPGSPFFGGDK